MTYVKILFLWLIGISALAQTVDQYKTTTAGGSVNAYTIPNSDFGAYRTNEKWLIDFTGVTTNSGAATLNRNSYGVVSIKMPDGTDPTSGILTGRVPLSYNGTYFYVVGGAGSSGGSSTLSGLTDVNVSSSTNNQFLRYKTSDSKWHNDSFVAGTDYEVPLTFTSPLSRSTNTISGGNALADGSTKGFASFEASDFNATLGNISLDYTNGQSASGSTKGFLSSGDWTNFNTAYNRSGTGLTFSSSTFTFTKQDASTLTVSVPTFNQNTTGSAATLTTPRNINNVAFDGSADILINPFINAQSGTSYTLVLSDNTKTVEMTNASASTVTIPLNASVAFPISPATAIQIASYGAGGITIVATGGVTIRSSSGTLTIPQYSFAVLIKRATDEWYLENGTSLTGAALTGSGDSYITVTPGGSSSSALLNAASISVSLTGTIPTTLGGTGNTSLTAYAPLFGGTTGTGSIQSGTVGTSGQVLTSNGAGVLPTFQTISSGWGLSGTSTLSGGSVVITSNASRQLTFNGTWTASANNDYHTLFGGTFTGRSNNNDVIYGYEFNPNFVHDASNPTGQASHGVYIKQPTITGTGAFTATSSLLVEGGGTLALSALRVGNSSFTGPLAIYQTANNSATIETGSTGKLVIDNRVTAMTSFAVTNSVFGDGTSTFKQLNGLATGSASGSMIILTAAGTFGPSGGNTAKAVSISATSSNQTTGAATFLSIDATINLNANATAAPVTLIEDNVTETNVTGLSALYGLKMKSTRSLNSFGVTSPTARLELGGNMSSTSWTTTGIQMAFDAATYTDTGTSGTRATAAAIGIAQPTFAATNTVTNTDAYTWYIANSPAQGTGVTNTRSWALSVNAGNVNHGGKTYLGATGVTPTALLMLSAGTASANTAPLKFTAGTPLTTGEAGVMDYDGTNFLLYPSTTKHYVAEGLKATATLDFGSTLAGNATDLTITVTGASVKDLVFIGVDNASTLSDGSFTAWVSAADTVTVRFTNNSLTLTLDPSSGDFTAFVIKK